jgi:predicted DNA-binding WGR domain protein
MERVFYGLVFRKKDAEKNQDRVYVLLWQENLFGEWELVRIWGRAGTNMRRMKTTPYPSLEAAWPEIRRIVRRRLRHGYRAARLS